MILFTLSTIWWAPVWAQSSVDEGKGCQRPSTLCKNPKVCTLLCLWTLGCTGVPAFGASHTSVHRQDLQLCKVGIHSLCQTVFLLLYVLIFCGSVLKNFNRLVVILFSQCSIWSYYILVRSHGFCAAQVVLNLRSCYSTLNYSILSPLLFIC